MPTNKPLSYQSLLCVFQYMDNEKRTESARFIPAFHNFHKLVPRNIKHLVLDRAMLKIDNIEHTFQAFNTDLELALTQGDIHIEDQRDEEHRQFGEGLQDLFERVEQLIRPQDGTQRENVISYNIKNCLTHLVHDARLPQGIKIRDALRKQIQWSFNQKWVHKVKHLAIGFTHGVLRLPKGLKFRIRELSLNFNGNAVINAIMPILEKSSFPLRKLSVSVTGNQDPVFQNEVLRTSESLYIDAWTREAGFLVNLTNTNIHIVGNEINLEDIVALARNWIENPRRIGTKFSCPSEALVLWYMEQLKVQLQAVETRIPSRKCNMFPICNTVQLNLTSELNMYVFESSDHEQEMERDHGKPYMIVMEVMPIGSAVPLDS